jgi:hypothetical protein
MASGEKAGMSETFEQLDELVVILAWVWGCPEVVVLAVGIGAWVRPTLCRSSARRAAARLVSSSG